MTLLADSEGPDHTAGNCRLLRTFTANLADDKSIIFLFLPENRIWHQVQIVSVGENLHEMPNPIFLKKNKIRAQLLVNVLLKH